MLGTYQAVEAHGQYGVGVTVVAYLCPFLEMAHFEFPG